MKITKKLVIILVLAALMIVVAARQFAGAETIHYITEKAQVGSIRQSIDTVGEVGAMELVNVGAQVSGQITTLNVAIGDVVRRGDLIAEIDATAQQNEIATHQAKLRSYQTALTAAEITLKIAAAKYQRAQQLFAVKTIAADELENFENEYEKARAALINNQSQIQQTEILLATAEKNLAYTKIVAPLDGTIVSLPVKVGQTLNSGFNTPSIGQIADLTKVQVLIEISEGDIAKVRPGMTVKFSTIADLTQTYEAPLKSIDPALTILTNNAYTGTVGAGQAVFYYGRLEVPNPDGALRIGMTTQNVIEISVREEVLRIPASAVFERDGAKYVTVLTRGEPQETPITVGAADNLFVEVISGLTVGADVVVSAMTASELKRKEAEIPEGLRR